jgi:hypothetical protein
MHNLTCRYAQFNMSFDSSGGQIFCYIAKWATPNNKSGIAEKVYNSSCVVADVADVAESI